MTIYFAGTERDAVEGGYAITTDSIYFDSAYSNLAVWASNWVSCGYRLAAEVGAGSGYWLAFTARSFFTTSWYVYGPWLQVYDADNAQSCRIDTNLPTFLSYVLNQAGDSYAGPQATNAVDVVLRYDVHCYTDGGNVKLDVYRNNLLISSASGAGANRGLQSFAFFGGTENGGTAISEIIVADEPTLGMRVKTYRPTADGTHTTWAGNYDNINNDDVGIDAISTQLPNAAETFLHGATLNEGTAIRALCVGAAAASEDPTGAHGIIYSGGTLHHQAFVKPLAQGAPPNVAIWETNPATGLAWTPAEFNALEFGVQHAA